MRFNINNYVRVKLTDFGRKAHREWHNRIFSHWPPEKCAEWYRAPQEDADGWSEWQLWCLMQEIGWACSNGVHPPIETEIEIVEKPL